MGSSCNNKKSVSLKGEPGDNYTKKEKEKENIINTSNAINNNKTEIVEVNDLQLSKTKTGIQQISINDFIKGKIIGKSHISEVYNGLSALEGDLVAIKIIYLEKVYNKNYNNNEIQHKLSKLANQLIKVKDINHPNLIKFTFTDDSLNPENLELTLIYEFSNGASVEKLLEKYGNFEERTIKLYIKQILLCLDFLHEKGFEHKCLKPSNILIDGDGTVRISDLLIDAFILGENKTEIEASIIEYSSIPKWIAPELLIDCQSIIGKCDIWSLGCLIIEMLKQNSLYSECLFENNIDFVSYLKEINKVPNIPDNLTKQCILFIEQCLTIDQLNRPNAKKLLEHEFLSTKVILKQQSTEAISNIKADSFKKPEENLNLIPTNLQNLLMQEGNNNDNSSYIEDDYDIYEINSDIENSYQIINREKSFVKSSTILDTLQKSMDNSNNIILIGKQQNKFNNYVFSNAIRNENNDLGNITPINMTINNNPLKNSFHNQIQISVDNKDKFEDALKSNKGIGEIRYNDISKSLIPDDINDITVTKLEELQNIMQHSNTKHPKIMLIKKKNKGNDNKPLDIEYIRRKIQNNKLYLNKC